MFFSMFSLHVQSCMHLKFGSWFVFACVSLFVSVYVINLHTTECLAWDRVRTLAAWIIVIQ